MTEHSFEPAPDASDVGFSEPVGAVDGAVAGLDALDGLPVEEHVAVFEQTHERLRRALDAQP